MTDTDYTLTGFAVPEGIEQLHGVLARVTADHPAVPADDVMMFETAVIELANNVVEHGVPEGGVRWAFRLRVAADRLEATLTDSGQEFEGELGAEMPSDPMADSGRGLPLAQATLDELVYERVGDSNRWRMMRRLGRHG